MAFSVVEICSHALLVRKLSYVSEYDFLINRNKMRTIKKVNVEVKDDEVLISPADQEKHAPEEVNRVRICCRYGEYPESFFYMGKGADSGNWIPESSTPAHLSSQLLAKIAWQLKNHLQ
jgi:hypothetical protein